MGARAHVLVHTDSATFADFESGRLGQRRVRPHADREDRDVRRVGLAGLRPDPEGAPFGTGDWAPGTDDANFLIAINISISRT